MHLSVVITKNTPIPTDKMGFLQKQCNKQAFIKFLALYQQAFAVHVLHAEDEGDADVVIVSQAIDLSATQNVTVIADDTDILVLLIHHKKKGIVFNFLMYSKCICLKAYFYNCIYITRKEKLHGDRNKSAQH